MPVNLLFLKEMFRAIWHDPTLDPPRTLGLEATT